MSVVGAFVFPHPPVLVPAVGGGKEAEAAKTLEAFFSAADLLASLEPELIVFISPHMQYYSDCFIVPACKKASGGFAKFGAPKTTLNAAYDKDFAKILTAAANSAGARTETPCHPERSEGSYAANSAGAHTETPCHPERSEGSYAANSA
ncbi:MAG: hypothetical protein FWE82_10385, partial [Defluviitaleaceae bacterium]|nr:hypothetical protein [Defluviitaleaceae bacterium]